jgi:uncharacterized protein YgiM (DUF1202 family)
MKKTLALFLALVTILSIALVACKSNTPPVSSNDADDDVWADRANTSETSTDTSNNKTKGGWTEVNYTIYAMANDLNIREDDSASSKSLGKVNIGAALTATAKSDDWYKISYNDGEAYVSADYITTDASEATFTDLTAPETLVIKEDTNNSYGEKGRNVNLRSNPVFDDESPYTTIYRNNTQNNELKKIAVNGKNNIWKVTYNNETYYIGAGAFQHFEGYNASTGGVG